RTQYALELLFGVGIEKIADLRNRINADASRDHRENIGDAGGDEIEAGRRRTEKEADRDDLEILAGGIQECGQPHLERTRHPPPAIALCRAVLYRFRHDPKHL